MIRLLVHMDQPQTVPVKMEDTKKMVIKIELFPIKNHLILLIGRLTWEEINYCGQNATSVQKGCK